MVEFAITVPVLLFLLLGLIDVGDGMNSYLTVVAASRDAARLGSQGESEATMRTAVAIETGRLRANVPTVSTLCTNAAGVCIKGVSATYNVASSSGAATKGVYVKVCYDHSLLISFAGVIPDPLRMCSTTVMRMLS